MGPDDLGHVAYSDVSAALTEQHGLADVLEVAELVAGAHQVAGLGLVEAAAGLVEVFRQQPAVDLVHRETEQGQATLVDTNLDLLLVAAVHLDSGHTFGGLQVFLDQFLGHVAQLVEAVTA